MKVSFIILLCFALIFGIIAGCTDTGSVSNNMEISNVKFILGDTKSPIRESYYPHLIFTITNKGTSSLPSNVFKCNLYDKNGNFMKKTVSWGGNLEPRESETIVCLYEGDISVLDGVSIIGEVDIVASRLYNDKSIEEVTYKFTNIPTGALSTQITVPIPPTYTSSISTPKNIATSNKLSNTEWIWSRDHWEGWQHTAVWSGREAGPNSEYGPVMIGDHGEYGTDTQIYGGSTQSSVWRTFNDPSGIGWNTIEFTGMLTATDTPLKRWMTIDVNNQQVFKGTAAQNPPGNGVSFKLKRSFNPSSTVKVKISNGQDSAFGGRFAMYYYSVKLSREN